MNTTRCPRNSYFPILKSKMSNGATSLLDDLTLRKPISYLKPMAWHMAATYFWQPTSICKDQLFFHSWCDSIRWLLALRFLKQLHEPFWEGLMFCSWIVCIKWFVSSRWTRPVRASKSSLDFIASHSRNIQEKQNFWKRKFYLHDTSVSHYKSNKNYR